MAQLDYIEILERILKGEFPGREGVAALIKREVGIAGPSEGQLVDYKIRVDLSSLSSIAELARDILGFANSDGGLIIFGIDDALRVVGHERLDSRDLRNKIGPFLGTRVDFEVDECSINIGGKSYRVPFVLVRRSVGSFPNLLRKDIELRPGLVKKMKYLSGSLIYRSGSQTIAEPVYGDVEARARELRFSGVAPRTRSSFLLAEDRPGLRLYAHINDRFFGRESELSELLAKFDDPRGKGVSIAGFGGVGKTELGIRLVEELYRRGKFKIVYSGSAKQTLLGPGGPQKTDPAFFDLPSFLRDFAAWLGLNPVQGATTEELDSSCISELAKYKRVLLFVDNLETITDPAFFEFLDRRLPDNCWVLTTSRVHKVRSFVYHSELRELEARDAAQLLRHELKRQGLEGYASTTIQGLMQKSAKLYGHPLAIRWFAWACGKDSKLWDNEPKNLDMRQLEDFCVAHTLGSVSTSTQKVLGALIAISGVIETNSHCIGSTSGVPESSIEPALWELECAGLISSSVSEETGTVTYVVAPMTIRPAGDLARKKGWEGEYTANLKEYIRSVKRAAPESPLIRDLLNIEPRKVQEFTESELEELDSRIDRAIPRCPQHLLLQLKVLKAECQRHLRNPVSADDLYRSCADEILSNAFTNADTFRIRVLLEAATVAKIRAQTEPQLARAIRYLKVVEQSDVAAPRVLGMLTEFYALVGDVDAYETYRKKAEVYLRDHSSEFEGGLEDALDRARGQINRAQRKR
jgi:hypothetical protein